VSNVSNRGRDIAPEATMITRTRTLAAAAVLAATAGLAGHTLEVTAVERGDVLVLGGSWTTRLVGVRAPAPDQRCGREALAFTRTAVDGTVVGVFTLTRDNTAATIVRDPDGMPLAEIRCGADEDVDLAAELLRRGLAYVDDAFLPEHLAHYRDIERGARRSGRGVWGAPPTCPRE
jgi:endonuclease YncB( thermonuclease family)